MWKLQLGWKCNFSSIYCSIDLSLWIKTNIITIIIVTILTFTTVHPSSSVCVPLKISACISQNVPNKIYFVFVQCEKYAFLVTLRLLGSMKSGKAETHNTFIGKANPNYAYQNLLKCFITSQCRFQAVACISTTKMYPRKWVLPTNINPKINIKYCHFCTAFKSCLFFVQVQ